MREEGGVEFGSAVWWARAWEREAYHCGVESGGERGGGSTTRRLKWSFFYFFWAPALSTCHVCTQASSSPPAVQHRVLINARSAGEAASEAGCTRCNYFSLLQDPPYHHSRMSDAAVSLCSVSGCGKPSTATCNQCTKQKYCSRECQAADWKMHKKSCFPPPAVMPKCSGCGGWGIALLGENGKCGACTAAAGQ